MATHRDERVFLIRLWREGEASDARDWRGSVHDVASGSRRYVASPAEIADFVAAALRRAEDTEGH